MGATIWYRARSLSGAGSALQEIRRDVGISQDDAARQIGSSRPTLSRMERGEAVQSDVLFDLAARLGYEFVLVPRGSDLKVSQS